VFPNEKREISAGCTEDRRAGWRAAPKASPAGCRKGQPSDPPISAGHLNMQPTGLSCSAACRPTLPAARQSVEN